MFTFRDRNPNDHPTSRYKFVREVEEVSGIYLDLPSFKSIPESPGDIYHVVSVNDENRLDRVSHTYYDTTELYWVIALANGIVDPLTVKAGLVLRVPPIDIIFGPEGVL